MKIRDGFVSNSSSSSFVISQGNDSIIDVADHMISCRNWENDDDLKKKLQGLKLPDGVGISFDTCNARTYILPLAGHFLIQTCHNHNFDLYSVGSISKELAEALEDLDWGNAGYEGTVTEGRSFDGALWQDFSMNLAKVGRYYYLEYDVIGSKPAYEEGRTLKRTDKCAKTHFDDLIKIDFGNGNYEIVCPECRFFIDNDVVKDDDASLDAELIISRIRSLSIEDFVKFKKVAEDWFGNVKLDLGD